MTLFSTIESNEQSGMQIQSPSGPNFSSWGKIGSIQSFKFCTSCQGWTVSNDQEWMRKLTQITQK